MGNRAILAVDAGGTSIKYSLVSNDTLDQLTEEHFFNMPSSGTKEELMGTFAAFSRGQERAGKLIVLSLLRLSLYPVHLTAKMALALCLTSGRQLKAYAYQKSLRK